MNNIVDFYENRLLNLPPTGFIPQMGRVWENQGLCSWVTLNLANRLDCYGDYYPGGTCTKVATVNFKLLMDHFSGQSNRVGLHSYDQDGNGKWLCVDIDAHDGPHPTNWKIALEILIQLHEWGIKALCEHTNGNFGFHIWILFDSPLHCSILRSIGLYLIQDRGTHEVFPKQSQPSEFGSYVRLPGRHHKNLNHFSDFYDLESNQWLRGESAVNHILEHVGNSIECVPEVARGFVPMPMEQVTRNDFESSGIEDYSEYDGRINTLDILGLSKEGGRLKGRVDGFKYDVVCPWEEEHTTANTGTCVCERVDDSPPWFSCLHSHCANRRLKAYLSTFPKEMVERYCEEKKSECKMIDESAVNDAVFKFDSPGVKPESQAEPLPTQATIEQMIVKAVETITQKINEPKPKKEKQKSKSFDELAKAFVERMIEIDQHPVFTGGRTYLYEKCKYRECEELPVKVRKFFQENGWSQSNNVIGNVVPIVQTYCWRDAHQYGQMPFFIDGENRSGMKSIIAFTNGLLDSEKHGAALIPHSPNWVSTFCLPFAFDPVATCPKWLKFLSESLEGDLERVQMLQEFFGYCLSQDTKLQKALLLIGKPRSGKGTVQAILGDLIGSDSSIGFSLDKLSTEFGASALLGKTVAIVGEVELSNNPQRVKIVEVLKSIIGEDQQSINAKYEDMKSVRLPTRFVIAANSMPRLMDSSGAMAARMLFIPFEKSFLGQEDINLKDKLRAELPGIANWALDGLKRLRANGGKFTSGQKHSETAEKFAQETSPLVEWIKARMVVSKSCDSGDLPPSCIVAEKTQVCKKVAYQSYTSWCDEKGLPKQEHNWFGKDLITFLPKVKPEKIKVAESWVWGYVGIGERVDSLLVS